METESLNLEIVGVFSILSILCFEFHSLPLFRFIMLRQTETKVSDSVVLPPFVISLPHETPVNQLIQHFIKYIREIEFYKQLDRIDIVLDLPVELKSDSKETIGYGYEYIIQDPNNEERFYGMKSAIVTDEWYAQNSLLLSDLPSFVKEQGFSFTLECHPKQTALTPHLLFVKLKTGKTITIFCDLKTWTIKDVKNAIALKTGTHVSCFPRLIFAGSKLEDHKLLSEYNIQKESTLHDVLNLRGGMYDISSGRSDFISINPRHFNYATSALKVHLHDNDVVSIPCNPYIQVDRLLTYLMLFVNPKKHVGTLSKQTKLNLLNDQDNLTPNAIYYLKKSINNVR